MRRQERPGKWTNAYCSPIENEQLLKPSYSCSQLYSSQQKQTINSLIQLLSSKLLTNVALIWRHVESGKYIWRTGHNHQHLSLLRNRNTSCCSSPACLFFEGILQSWMAEMRIFRDHVWVSTVIGQDDLAWSMTCLGKRSEVAVESEPQMSVLCKAAASSSSQSAAVSRFCL